MICSSATGKTTQLGSVDRGAEGNVDSSSAHRVLAAETRTPLETEACPNHLLLNSADEILKIKSTISQAMTW